MGASGSTRVTAQNDVLCGVAVAQPIEFLAITYELQEFLLGRREGRICRLVYGHSPSPDAATRQASQVIANPVRVPSSD
jgi:hypothetical protein